MTSILTDRIYVREQDSLWRVGPPSPEESAELSRRLRARERALLRLLMEHHYLATGHVRTLLYGSSTEVTLRHLRALKSLKLVSRWRQLEPIRGGYRQHDGVWSLTQRGAGVAATLLRWDVASAVRRSYTASTYSLNITHALGSVDFWLRLIAASRGLPDQGVWSWMGDDEARARYRAAEVDIAPDGAGRYLLPDRELDLLLELDLGTEPLRRIAAKGQAYVEFFDDPEDPTRVLWVAPTERREASLNRALSGLTDKGRFLTTHAALVEAEPLGAVWRPARKDAPDGRLPLARVEGWDRSPAHRVEDCIGRPDWYLGLVGLSPSASGV